MEKSGKMMPDNKPPPLPSSFCKNVVSLMAITLHLICRNKWSILLVNIFGVESPNIEKLPIVHLILLAEKFKTHNLLQLVRTNWKHTCSDYT